jgi:hypothetical protein
VDVHIILLEIMRVHAWRSCVMQLERVRLCISGGKEDCALRVGFPHLVIIRPWDAQPWGKSPSEGCKEAPAHLDGGPPTCEPLP